ncbi:hypothetical protein M501DRAFT_952176 [Patellaria atrata CBS 101060]|uniref:Thiolase-like protein type 1 additional C-terminal domain-containing protein n=1 Tax=Patellaria atrata CBS 101060 TaxID=1346257 RepID=A0A9P4VS66_9PEZI|nr:hypothetical protein M501DRAFT_952176 [Patellaria atrata CBS 101060]
MHHQRPVPVIIGVGDIKNSSRKLEDAVEPAQLMFQAISAAIDDTQLTALKSSKLKSSIDSINVVRTWTWPYPDLPNLLARKLDLDHFNALHKFYSDHGGDKPAKLLDLAARKISLGQSKVAVVTGGEALASLTACAKAKKLPPPGWTKPEEEVKTVFSPTGRNLGDNVGSIHNLGAPISVYPLYENALRAHRHQSIKENNNESAELYARFAQVASKNPYAWNYDTPAATEHFIGTPSQQNRMICFPYTLLMNAFNTVNLAAACILTSTQYAEELGIPKSQWIYLLGGAGTRDSDNFWDRPNYHTSPSISRSIDAAMKVSSLSKDQVDLFDIYSCFPIVPKLACAHLGFSITNPPKPITLLGGLTSFGGAGNNYSMHAITAMTRALRHGPSTTGLILANGGVLTYQHAVCLSSKPRADGKPYPDHNPLPLVLDDVPGPPVEAQAEGEAVIETYTVSFSRTGKPEQGHIVGRLKGNGHRFLANDGDEATLLQLCGVKEMIGRIGWVRSEFNGKRNLFYFTESGVKL